MTDDLFDEEGETIGFKSNFYLNESETFDIILFLSSCRICLF